MLPKIIFFICSVLIVVGGSGLVVFHSFSRWFLLPPFGKFVFMIVLAVVLAGFFVASVLSHLSESRIAKYVYMFFAVLMGIYVFVFFSAIAGWAAVWLSQAAHIAINEKILGAALVALALACSGYNMWNARNIQIKHIHVRIPDLPAQWKGKTIIQLSDVHLGNILGPKFLESVVQKVSAQNPDMIAITGDLFDGMDGDLPAFVEPLNNMRAKEGVYFVTGNHEHYLGVEKVRRILDQTHIQFINDTIVHKNGLQIIGISYGQDFQPQNIKKIIAAQENYDPNVPSVLLYHIPLPSQIREAKLLGIDLQLSGHTHVGQLFPFEFITRIVFRGYDYGLHRDGDFTEYTSSGVGTWGPPMRSGNKPEIVVVHLE